MSWALQIPKASLPDSSARHVLLCLANYAGTDGRGAFPSANTLSDDTGLSERTVRAKLDVLRVSGWIVPGNQALAAVYIERHDRRPVVYDLPIKRGANPAPRSERVADNRAGCNSQQNGVQPTTDRGAESAPNPSLNHQVTEQQQPHVFADVADEQDREVLEQLQSLTDTRQRFSMFADWNANGAVLAAQLQIMGITAALTEETFGSFIGFHIAKPDIRDTDSGWCHRLAKWIKRQATESAASEAPADWAAKGVRL